MFPDAWLRHPLPAAAPAGARRRGQLRDVPRERRQPAAVALVPPVLTPSREWCILQTFLLTNKISRLSGLAIVNVLYEYTKDHVTVHAATFRSDTFFAIGYLIEIKINCEKLDTWLN